jgi:hypothetical protein
LLLLVTVSPAAAAALGAVWLPLFVAAIAAFGAALVRLLTSAMPGLPRPDGRLRTADWQIVRRRVPAWLLALSALTFAAAWLIGMAAASGLPGEPQQVDGGYVASNHGELIPLTKAEYERAVAAQTRLFTSGALAFATMAVVMTLAAPLPPGRLRR